MTSHRLSFSASGLTLQGVLHRPSPEKECPFVVIGSHGLLSTKESAKQKCMAEICTQLGAAYLRIDHRGCGESQGLFLDTTIYTRVEDLLAAGNALKGMGFGQKGLALFGSSMGAATCLAGWNALDGAGFQMKGVVSLAAPVDGRGITEAALAAQNELHGVPISFYKENMGFDISKGLKEIHHIFVAHGDADEIVPVANAHRIMKEVKNPKEMAIYSGGDHRLSGLSHQRDFLEKARLWFKALFS